MVWGGETKVVWKLCLIWSESIGEREFWTCVASIFYLGHCWFNTGLPRAIPRTIHRSNFDEGHYSTGLMAGDRSVSWTLNRYYCSLWLWPTTGEGKHFLGGSPVFVALIMFHHKQFVKGWGHPTSLGLLKELVDHGNIITMVTSDLARYPVLCSRTGLVLLDSLLHQNFIVITVTQIL